MIGLRKTEGLSDEERQEIVKRAGQDVGKYYPYLLTTDNCEHQVKYWISGNKDYRQVYVLKLGVALFTFFRFVLLFQAKD